MCSHLTNTYRPLVLPGAKQPQDKLTTTIEEGDEKGQTTDHPPTTKPKPKNKATGSIPLTKNIAYTNFHYN